jgi:hypothetical protein
MKYNNLKLLKSPQSHVIQIKEKNSIKDTIKENINPQKPVRLNTLDVYYVNLGKIRL